MFVIVFVVFIHVTMQAFQIMLPCPECAQFFPGETLEVHAFMCARIAEYTARERTNGSNADSVASFGEGKTSAIANECPICFREFYNTFITPCGHAFCVACARKWFATSRKCPMCNGFV